MRTEMILLGTLLLVANSAWAQQEAPAEAPTVSPMDSFSDASAEISAPEELPEGVTDSFSFALLPHFGMTIPTSKLGVFIVAGLEVDVALPFLGGRLLLALDASATRPAHEGRDSDPRAAGDYEFTVEETELKLGLGAVYRFAGMDSRLVPFAGLGPILHLLRTTQTSSLAPGENTEEDTKLGVELQGGVDVRMGPGALTAEARLVYSSLDHVMTGDTNAGNVTLSLGYRFLF